MTPTKSTFASHGDIVKQCFALLNVSKTKQSAISKPEVAVEPLLEDFGAIITSLYAELCAINR